jgi:hypothetical protein
VSAVFNCYWASPAKSFSGISLAELMSINFLSFTSIYVYIYIYIEREREREREGEKRKLRW